MQDDIQVIGDDDGDIQVLNGGNCNMDKGNYLFYKLVNKIKSQDDIHRKLNNVNQREWNEQETNKTSNVKIPAKNPTNTEIALKQLVSNVYDQKAKNTNKKTEKNNDTYIVKGFEKELDGFDNALELNIEEDRSLELFGICNKDNEIPIVEDKSIDVREKCNKDDGIALGEESNLEPFESLKIVRQITGIDNNSLDPLNKCNQEKYKTLGNTSIDSSKNNKTTKKDKSLESLDSEFFENYEDNRREYPKKIAVKGLKPSLPLKLQSQPLSKSKCSECDFTSENKHYLKEHEQGVHDGVARFMCNHCEQKSFYKYDMVSHQEKMHINEEDKRILE